MIIAVSMAIGSAFVLPKPPSDCDDPTKTYGKVDLTKPDTDPTAFVQVSTVNSTCVFQSGAFCKYYKVVNPDNSVEFFPCEGNENQNVKFVIIP